MIERAYLLQALRDLGFDYMLSNNQRHLRVRGRYGRPTRVEIKVPLTNAGNDGYGYDIGFRKEGRAYVVIAHWIGIRHITRQQFVWRVQQRYAYHAVREQARARGLTLVSEELLHGGQVHLVFRAANQERP